MCLCVCVLCVLYVCNVYVLCVCFVYVCIVNVCCVYGTRQLCVGIPCDCTTQSRMLIDSSLQLLN
ncbi:unnamed protein product [Musa textilis]